MLDELEFLAEVEHAFLAECLSVCRAPGHDLNGAEGGTTTNQGGDAAAASALAQDEMDALDAINRALVQRGLLPSFTFTSLEARRP